MTSIIDNKTSQGQTRRAGARNGDFMPSYNPPVPPVAMQKSNVLTPPGSRPIKSPLLTMTTANKITILRIILVPFFVVQMLYYTNSGNEWYRLLALLSFAIAALSDALDGYIARRYNQHSELGALLDPLADKLLLVSGVVLLSFNHEGRLPQLPLWVTAVILGRDLILSLGLAAIYFTCGKAKVRPIMLGKISTVLQMGTVIWGLLKWPEPFFLLLAGITACCAILSGIIYAREGIRQLSASPSSSASPKP
jgi:CDP-diacylglycerol--glycerol-3-phosphate 3-phosphatidyltransferase